jgi:hypothetical protein
MKQRKPPFVLGGILVVALCAIVFIGIKFAKEAVPESDNQPPVAKEEPPVGKPREAPSKEEMATVVGNTGGKEATEPKPAPMPMKGGPRAAPDVDRFSVEIPTASEQKPVKNPTATSGQWW